MKISTPIHRYFLELFTMAVYARFTLQKGSMFFFILTFVSFGPLNAQYTTPSVNGSIGTNEYGVHTNGMNQNVTNGLTTYMTWNGNDLFLATSGASTSEAFVIYIDKDPQIPVNGGSNLNGTNVGFNYDGAGFVTLQFRADIVLYVKNGYKEYRLADGNNGWGSSQTGWGSYSDNNTNNNNGVQEVSLPWSTIGGLPSSFNFFSYKVNGSGFVYGAQPTENLSTNTNIGNSARWDRYFTVSTTNDGSSTKPFSRNSYVFNSTADLNSFGAISVWDFTMNTSGRQIARLNTGGDWAIGGTLVVGAGTIFFGSGGSGYGASTVSNVNVVGGSLNLDQTNKPLNISGNFTNNGIVTLSSINGGDLKLQGNFIDNATFNSNSRAVFFTGTGVQDISGTASAPFNIDYIVLNKASGAVRLLVDLLTGAPNGGTAVTLTNTADILDVNGKTFTIGTAGSASTISGNGKFKGSSTSGLILLGTGSLGTLNFDQTTDGTTNALNNFILNRTSTGSATIGSKLNLYGALTLTAGTLNTSNVLTLKSNAANTALVAPVSGTISGNVTIERFIGTPTAKRAWRLLTAPLRSTTSAVSIYQSWQNGGNTSVANNGTLITGPMAGNGIDANSPGNSLKEFNGTALTGVNNTNSATLFTTASSAANKGYFIFIRADRTQALPATGTTTLQATGALQTGDQVFITTTGASKRTLIGNPYASPVDFDLLRQDNLAAFTPFNNPAVLNTFYYWDPKIGSVGGYITVSYDGVSAYTINNGGSRIIQSGQAIFLQNSAGSAGGTPITFKEAHKSTTVQNTAFREGSKVEKLRIDLNLKNTDETFLLTDGIIARYNNIYSKEVGYDDAEKLLNIDENLGFLRNGQVLSIEGRPLIDADDTLFLQMTNMKMNRTYQFNITASDFSAPSLNAFLQDDYLKTSTPINLESETIVPFSINADVASKAANRFMIVFKSNSVLPISFTNVKAFEKGSNIQVEWNLGNEAGIAKYEVEKSTDGRTFSKAGTKAIRNLLNSTENYNWLDVTPNSGNNFYRIKALEQNGGYKFSQVVNVKLGKGNSSISVYPNPVSGHVMSLQMVNQPKGKYAIQLFNNLGQQVYRSELNHIGGSATQTMKLNNKIAGGTYQLQVTNGDSKIAQQVVVE